MAGGEPETLESPARDPMACSGVRRDATEPPGASMRDSSLAESGCDSAAPGVWGYRDRRYVEGIARRAGSKQT